LAAKIRLIEQLVAGIVRRERLQPKGARDVAKLLADNDVAAAPGWPVPQGLEQVKSDLEVISGVGAKRTFVHKMTIRARE